MRKKGLLSTDEYLMHIDTG